jgi:PHD/YefM family antitoxin component YafN of YafNO toxin-antitoxin module
METTIKINTDSITPEFIEGIKKLFPQKTVEITIQPADETDYILSNPVFTQVLQDRIAAYVAKNELITVKMSDAEYKAYQLYLESIKVMLNAGKKVSKKSSLAEYLANAENSKELEAGMEDVKAGRITYIDPKNLWEDIK